MDQVNAADRYTICSWNRFLDSPGMAAINANKSSEECNAAIDAEAIIMDRIVERLEEFGGFTPEISKSLGWG